MRALLCLALIFSAPLAAAQDLAVFGDWRATCSPTAGCALGTKSEGEHLAFSEPLKDDPRLLFFPETSVKRGSVIHVTLDGFEGATLGPADGWRSVKTEAAPAIQIAPSITRFELHPRMLRAQKIEFAYTAEDGTDQRSVFSLNGYADARGYADGE